MSSIGLPRWAVARPLTLVREVPFACHPESPYPRRYDPGVNERAGSEPKPWLPPNACKVAVLIALVLWSWWSCGETMAEQRERIEAESVALRGEIFEVRR